MNNHVKPHSVGDKIKIIKHGSHAHYLTITEVRLFSSGYEYYTNWGGWYKHEDVRI